eukprot:2247322-Rhodomonas_salina.2
MRSARFPSVTLLISLVTTSTEDASEMLPELLLSSALLPLRPLLPFFPSPTSSPPLFSSSPSLPPLACVLKPTSSRRDQVRAEVFQSCGGTGHMSVCT